MTAVLDTPAFDMARYEAEGYDGVVETIDRTGDTKVMWDKSNPTEVAMAKAAFDAGMLAGALAYKANKKGEQKSDGRIKEFDATAERIVMVPQLVGG